MYRVSLVLIASTDLEIKHLLFAGGFWWAKQAAQCYVLKFRVSRQFADRLEVPEWTGFEVPAHLRERSPASFQNKGTLELGLHHRTLKKSPTEVFKFDIACSLNAKLTSRNSSWNQFARDVVGDLTRARRAYPESSARFSDQEVYTLLALDALFLVVLFKYVNGRSFFLREFGALDGRLSEILTVMRKTDFYLIENQVPMYLLKSAIKQLCELDDETADQRRLVDPAFQMVSKVEEELEMVLYEAVLHLNPFTYPDAQSCNDRLHRHLILTYPLEPLENSLINCQHLLDCVYRVICGHSLPFKVEPGVKSHLPLENIPSATRLAAVGIRVVGTVPTLREVRLSGTGYLKSAELQLPKVALYDYSESAFHNLALHEQRLSAGQCSDLRCYMQFMASLSTDLSDLQVLGEEGVVNSHAGSDALMGMWDRALRGVFTPFPSSAWVRCYRDIHRHRNARLKRWRFECWALFCAQPWTLVSVLAGLILLLLTGTQTWFTVHPPH